MIPLVPENYQQIQKRLLSGEVFVFPTDTIPGFSCDVENEMAIEKIQKLKKRPTEKPFLLLAGGVEIVERYVHFSHLAKEIAKEFWPGGMTMLLPRKNFLEVGNPNFCPQKMDTYFSHAPELAFRVPDNLELLEFLQFWGKPLVSTSINESGEEALLSMKDVQEKFPNIPLVKGVHKKSSTLPSTIVKVGEKNIEILREGVLPKHLFDCFQENF